MAKNDLLNLFEIPNVIVKVPTKWLFINSMIDSNTLFNAHLMVRYNAIKSYFNNDDKWWKIYNSMQYKRVLQNKLIPRDKINNEEKFKSLIDNFKENGFQDQYPIIINRNFRLVDGSHRLALALYFNVKYVPVRIDEKSLCFEKEYSLAWFKENGFNEIIDDLIDTYNYIIGR